MIIVAKTHRPGLLEKLMHGISQAPFTKGEYQIYGSHFHIFMKDNITHPCSKLWYE